MPALTRNKSPSHSVTTKLRIIFVWLLLLSIAILRLDDSPYRLLTQAEAQLHTEKISSPVESSYHKEPQRRELPVESSYRKESQQREALPDQEESQLFETIQVYRAKRDPKQLDARIWAGQVKQDEIVATLTNNQKQGYFVDLAANHAVEISNTYGLERNLQWNGLCIEANSQFWGELSKRQCQLVAAVVGRGKDEKINFLVRPHKDGLSGIVNQNFDNKQRAGTIGETTFVEDHYTIPLVDILRHNHAPKVIDYFTLDVEGAEFYVMEKFPFSEYQFRIVTIERPQKQLVSLLRANNYEFHAVIAGGDHGETLWFHRDHMSGLNIDAYKRKFPLPFNHAAEMAKYGS